MAQQPSVPCIGMTAGSNLHVGAGLCSIWPRPPCKPGDCATVCNALMPVGSVWRTSRSASTWQLSNTINRGKKRACHSRSPGLPNGEPPRSSGTPRTFRETRPRSQRRACESVKLADETTPKLCLARFARQTSLFRCTVLGTIHYADSDCDPRGQGDSLR